MSKKIITSGLALGLVAGGAAGLALNTSGNAGAADPAAAVATSPTDDTTVDTTAATGGTGDEAEPTRPDRSARLQEVLQPLIDAGTITQEQADAVIAALNEAGPPAGGGGRGGRHGGFGGPSLELVATTIGISEDDLRSALRDGQTIAEVAATNGSSAEAVISAVVAERTEQINAKVADGGLTQAEADERLAELETKVTEMVNETFAGRGGPGGPGGVHPSSTGGTDSTEPTATSATTGS